MNFFKSLKQLLSNVRHKKLYKILKWSTLSIIAYWFLTTLIFGHTNLDSRTGIQSFGWSGLDALFTNQKFGLFIDQQYVTSLDGVDGPYVYGNKAFSVNDENILVEQSIDREAKLIVCVNNDDNDQFEVLLRDSYDIQPTTYELPSKIIAISDIEGNFNAFYSFLISNKVINESYDWIYGDGHLVLNGDFFDRGSNVNQVLWLIYKLEGAAEKQGGKVHFILGNHEIMNLRGITSYAKHRYIEVAKQISQEKEWDKAYRFLYSANSELGKWLRTKNVIEEIGEYIFVHGGLNHKHVEQNLTLTEINSIAREYYDKWIKMSSASTKEYAVLHSYYSPYWDRSLAMSWLYKANFLLSDPFNAPIHKPTQPELEAILNFYDTEKIVIGHSVMEKVLADYGGKVIKIDVKHGVEKNSTKTQGLIIEKGIEYVVNGTGQKQKL